jgi:hypothetical protein
VIGTLLRPFIAKLHCKYWAQSVSERNYWKANKKASCRPVIEVAGAGKLG